MAYQSGASVTASSSGGFGLGIGGGGLAIGRYAGSSRGTQTSLLAQRLAPPRPSGSILKSFAAGWGILFVLIMGAAAVDAALSAVWEPAGIFAGAVLVLASLPGAVFLAVLFHRRSIAADRAASERWSSSWLCRRCGHVETAGAFKAAEPLPGG